MHPILVEIQEKYGEWLEMAGNDAPAMTIEIIAELLQKERDLNEYYKKIFNSAMCKEVMK